MFRVSNSEFSINGYKIPNNTQLIISPYMCGRNTQYFPNPLEFNPDRFLKDSANNEPKYIYI
jgi:cytochrome P450